MPKSYSEQERAYIRERLKEEAADCLEKCDVVIGAGRLLELCGDVSAKPSYAPQ